MQCKVLKNRVFLFNLAFFRDDCDKIDVKFAYMRKNVYLCRLFIRLYVKKQLERINDGI